MLRKILAISGRPGLFKIVNQGKNMLIVEDLATGRRTPAYARDKVSSLGDISIYTLDGDKPLSEVLEAVKEKNSGEQFDVKALVDEKDLRAYFAEILPDYDPERVYAADIRKLLNWYNHLIAAGINDFLDKEQSEAEKSE